MKINDRGQMRSVPCVTRQTCTFVSGLSNVDDLRAPSPRSSNCEFVACRTLVIEEFTEPDTAVAKLPKICPSTHRISPREKNWLLMPLIPSIIDTQCQHGSKT